jgi:FkbM family methyltransferase
MTWINNVAKTFEFIKRRYAPRGSTISFSQYGEDLNIKKILIYFSISNPSYLDIGAHHPVTGNNTYLFYKNGSSGVIVEPNEYLLQKHKTKRKRDVAILAGVGGKNTKMTFFKFSQDTRSTFSEEQALEWEKISGQKPETRNIEVFTLDHIIEKHFSNSPPDLVSIDAEGLDFEILSNFSWKSRPKVFCVETMETRDGQLVRNDSFYELFKAHGYSPMAETQSNTIFADTISMNTQK